MKEYKFKDEKFIIIDNVPFLIVPRIEHELGPNNKPYTHTNYINVNYDGFVSVIVYIQNDIQHDLIIEYNARMINDKIRKIRAYTRGNCFSYDIRKLKFEKLTIKNELDIAGFYSFSNTRKFVPYKELYTEEQKEVFKLLDIEIENIKKSKKIINKFNL